MFVDVADQAVVDPVPDQLLQPTRKMLGGFAGDTQLLVLLLPDVTGAVIHGDADPTGVSGVGAASVPQAAVPHENAPFGHFGRNRVVAGDKVGLFRSEVGAGDDSGGSIFLG